MLAIVSLFPLIQTHAQAQVRVWAGTITLPSSEEGPPDENPPFDLFAARSFNYPYALRQNIKNKRPLKTWRAIYLENEYLKCSVLPDLGGHVYTCFDKVSGQPMFYANPSIKEQLVSYRGAWAAFGVEFNFPVSHNWVSVSPVDFSYAAHPDGSASVTVGNIDRVYGMEWTVELTLRPRVARLETLATLTNRDRVRHRFYWWTNAGVQVWNDSKLYYPMRFSAAHGFKDVDTWPVNSQGMDLSVIGNHTAGPVSRFVYGSREPFMGIYHPHNDTGIVHYADYAELPGKKIWTWGVDPEGLQWRKALSDNDSAYAEVQAGLYRNQETFAFLEPQQVIQFRDYWMPVRNIGGITRANLHGVVFLKRETKHSDGTIALKAALNVNEDVPDASISILDGARVISQERTALDPARAWTKKIPGLAADHKYTFRLESANGATLLEHTEGKWDWLPKDEVHVGPQTQYSPPPEQQWTDGNFVDAGREQEQNGEVLKAWQTYRNGLRRYPSSYLLLKAAGRLGVQLLRYQEADEALAEAEARDTTDAEVHYYRGLALEALGQSYRARGEFEAATRMPEWRAAGSLELAQFLSRQGDQKAAVRWIENAELASPRDERIVEEHVILSRLASKPDALSIAASASPRFPVSMVLRIETARGQSDDAELWSHLAADSQRVVHAASEYMQLGDYQDALSLLERRYPSVDAGETEPGAVLPQDDPMVAYYRGYCREKLHQPAAADYRAASEMSARYIFPNRAESEPVLRGAVEANENDANAHWLLGALLFAHGQVDPALDQWRSARNLNPRIPALDAAFGRELLDEGNPQEAARILQQGVATDAANPAVYENLDRALAMLGQPPENRARMLQRFPKSAQMPSRLVFLLARNLADAGEFDSALSLFRNRYFESAEQGADVRRVYLEVKLKEALALARKGECKAALSAHNTAATPVAGLPFTQANLNDVLDTTPALQSLRSEIRSSCPSS